MKTTIAGQLALTMLAERLATIPDSQILMINTDGLEIKIPRIYNDLYFEICKKWEEDVKLTLEFDEYKKMWIADINTYGALTVKDKIKNKGRFEVDKVIGNEPAYHKDNSFRIIPLAIQEYFMNNIPIKTTIENHLNNKKYNLNKNYGIYDFCGRERFKGEDYGEVNYLATDITGNNYIASQTLQKNVRFFISKKGMNLIKRYKKGTCEFIHKGYYVTIFNKYYESDNYNINYDFYIKEAQKEIDNIEDKQLKLF